MPFLASGCEAADGNRVTRPLVAEGEAGCSGSSRLLATACSKDSLTQISLAKFLI